MILQEAKEPTEAEIQRSLANAAERVRDWLNGRLDDDSVDIARLYRSSREKLLDRLRRVYTDYLGAEPSIARAKQSGAMPVLDQAIDQTVNELADYVGTTSTHAMQSMLGDQPKVLRRYMRRVKWADLPYSSTRVLDELTTSTVGGGTFFDHLFNMTDKLKRDVTGVTRTALVNGYDFDQMRDQMMRAFGVDKLADPKSNVYGAVKVYKNAARREWNKLMGKAARRSDAIEVWWAVLDEETTPGCAARHGFEIKEDDDEPPRHINCRCTILVADPDMDLRPYQSEGMAWLKRNGYSRRQASVEEAAWHWGGAQLIGPGRINPLRESRDYAYQSVPVRTLPTMLMYQGQGTWNRHLEDVLAHSNSDHVLLRRRRETTEVATREGWRALLPSKSERLIETVRGFAVDSPDRTPTWDEVRYVRAAVACIEDGLVWAVRPRGTYVWTLPGGGVKDDEALRDAAAREMLEETGLRVQITRRLGVLDRGTSVSAIFEGQRINAERERIDTPEEIDAVMMVPIAQLVDDERRFLMLAFREAFDPAKHPRDKSGRFGHGGGGGHDPEKVAARVNATFNGIQDTPWGAKFVTITDNVTQSTAMIPMEQFSPRTAMAAMKRMRAKMPARASEAVFTFVDGFLEAFDPKKHPRGKTGTPQGGQFVSSAGGEGGEPGGMRDASDWSSGGGDVQTHTFSGKFLRDPGGTEYYVKGGADEDHLRTEALSTALYRAAGIAAPKGELVMRGGKLAYASQKVPGASKVDVGTLPDDPDIKAGFGMDAWLGSWDVAGMGHSNLIKDSSGRVQRIDTGGTLDRRAQGGTKPFGAEVSEIKSLRDPKINSATAKMFSRMTNAELRHSIARVSNFSDKQIGEHVDAAGFAPAKAASLTKTLIARRDFLTKWAKTLHESIAEAFDPAKHPRGKPGTPQGGKFVSKGQGGSAGGGDDDDDGDDDESPGAGKFKGTGKSGRGIPLTGTQPSGTVKPGDEFYDLGASCASKEELAVKLQPHMKSKIKVSAFKNQWDGSSSSTGGTLMRAAAAEMFGGDVYKSGDKYDADGAYSVANKDAFGGGAEHLKLLKEDMKKYIKAQYGLTQKLLGGPKKKVALYRGFSAKEVGPVIKTWKEGEIVEYTTGSLSSCSRHRETADAFGTHLVKIRVRAANILSFYGSGPGTTGEKEYIVIGDKTRFKAKVISAPKTSWQSETSPMSGTPLREAEVPYEDLPNLDASSYENDDWIHILAKRKKA